MDYETYPPAPRFGATRSPSGAMRNPYLNTTTDPTARLLPALNW